MEVENVTTTELAAMAAPYNPRKISSHNLAALQRSLRYFGPVQPVVVNKRTGHVVGGHQRIKAAQAEGIDHLPVVHVDLDEPSEKQLNLALNRITGDFDVEKLAAVLTDLETAGADLVFTGFTDAEIEELTRGTGIVNPGLTEPDAVPATPATPRTQAGDLIRLGDHRLLCGDATSHDDMKLLLDGQTPDCMWTDPPYGVSYSGKTKDALTISNDEADTLADLLEHAFDVAYESLAPGAVVYVCHPAGRLSVTFGYRFIHAGWQLRQTLIWVKDTIVLGHSDYHYRHEPILYGYKPGEARRGRGGLGWYGDNAQSSVIEVPRPRANTDHPTSKPVELIEICMRNSTKRNDLVLDPFLGSGSTLIACEHRGTRCVGIEIDPGYCDVIVRRWQDFTGQEAEGWRGND